MKVVIYLLSILVLTSFTTAAFGYNNLEGPMLSPEQVPFNNNTAYVNNSDLWNGNPWSDTRWRLWDNHTFNGNVDITGYIQLDGTKNHRVWVDGNDFKVDYNVFASTYANAMTFNSATGWSFNNYAVTTTGDMTGANVIGTTALKTGTMTLQGGSIGDSSGTIDFLDENLITAGTVTLDADNQKIFIGEGQDASVYYDGTNMYINPQEVGSGNLIIEGNNDGGDINFTIRNLAGDSSTDETVSLIAQTTPNDYDMGKIVFGREEDYQAGDRASFMDFYTYQEGDVKALRIDELGDFDFQNGTLTTGGDILLTRSDASNHVNIEMRNIATNPTNTASVDMLEGAGTGGFGTATTYGARLKYDGSGNEFKIQMASQSTVRTAVTVARDTTTWNFQGNDLITTGTVSGNGLIVQEGSDLQIGSTGAAPTTSKICFGDACLASIEESADDVLTVTGAAGLILDNSVGEEQPIIFKSKRNDVEDLRIQAGSSPNEWTWSSTTGADTMSFGSMTTYRQDNVKNMFGSSLDASIYYDATNMVINPKEVGSGFLNVTGDVDIIGRLDLIPVGNDEGIRLYGYNAHSANGIDISINSVGVGVIRGLGTTTLLNNRLNYKMPDNYVYGWGNDNQGDYSIGYSSANDDLQFMDGTTMDNNIRLALDSAGDWDFQAGDLTTTGNFTGNQFYGGVSFHNDSIGNLTALTEDIWANFTGFNQEENMQKLNGFTYSESNLIVQVTGTYDCNYGSTITGTANNKYHSSMGINGVVQESMETHDRITTGTDVMSMSGGWLVDLVIADRLTLMYMNEDSAGDTTTLSAHIKCIRIGD